MKLRRDKENSSWKDADDSKKRRKRGEEGSVRLGNKDLKMLLRKRQDVLESSMNHLPERKKKRPKRPKRLRLEPENLLRE